MRVPQTSQATAHKIMFCPDCEMLWRVEFEDKENCILVDYQAELEEQNNPQVS